MIFLIPFASCNFSDNSTEIILFLAKITKAPLSFLVVKDKNLDAHKDDNGAFVILAKNNIISVELSEKLQDAKGMRNIIAHEYGKINDAIVFHAVSEELVKDSRAFIDAVNKILGERKVDKAGDEED